MNELLVKKEMAGKRLDIFLTDFLNLSRSKVQKLIKQDLVLPNHKHIYHQSQK